MSEDKYWFALYTKPRSEFKAADQLKKLDITFYLPICEQLKKWSDRQKIITEPVLKGYIFIFVNEKERIASLQQPYVIRCVSDWGKPAKIPEWQIRNLQLMLSTSSSFSVHEGILPGTEIEILEGPFKGILGKVLSGDNEKLAVSIDLLNRSVVTHLPKESKYKILHNIAD